MLHLKGHLTVYLKSNRRCTRRWKKGALDVSLDDALKYEHVSAADGALDDSSEGTPTFEV